MKVKITRGKFEGKGFVAGSLQRRLLDAVRTPFKEHESGYYHREVY